jgi:large subunit ribosomal protein L6
VGFRYVRVELDAKTNAIVVTRERDSSTHRALHGTTRALIQNMITGVSTGYEQKMEIYGTGYSCAVQGQNLDLNVGYSHPILYQLPPSVKVKALNEAFNRLRNFDQGYAGTAVSPVVSCRMQGVRQFTGELESHR